ncbi:MAG: SPASM domain-containing protein, partial [Anaerolineales bacterium]
FETVIQNLQFIYRKDPNYYKDKILINCTIPFSTILLSLREYFEKYPYLFGGRLNISDVSDGNEEFSNNHPPYPDRTKDLIRLEREYCEAHCAGKASSATFHNSFVRQLLERSYLLFHRREILDPASNTLDRVNACFPGARKVFVDIEGRLHMCERVYRQFSIGDVWKGYDVEKIREVFNQFSAFMNSEECRQCWAVQMCPNCYTVGIDGDFPSQIKQGLCINHRQRLETIITNYCAVLERNPTAFDYMNNFKVS